MGINGLTDSGALPAIESILWFVCLRARRWQEAAAGKEAAVGRATKAPRVRVLNDTVARRCF